MLLRSLPLPRSPPSGRVEEGGRHGPLRAPPRLAASATFVTIDGGERGERSRGAAAEASAAVVHTACGCCCRRRAAAALSGSMLTRATVPGRRETPLPSPKNTAGKRDLCLCVYGCRRSGCGFRNHTGASGRFCHLRPLLPSPENAFATVEIQCRHRCRSRVAAATGGGCRGHHPTGSEGAVVRFSRSFLVSELESEFTCGVEVVSTIEKDMRNRGFDCRFWVEAEKTL
ncbi:uncharacterized protein DS421_14g473730 [Arachis hypogaea]|nr:uncharacterized protein DS421_14g473730 [Arachis hypogaea]